MSREHLAFTLDGRKKVKLRHFDPRDTGGLEKEAGVARLQELGEEFAELGNLLTFAGQDALLVVLQGRDASGKDGTIRKILDFSNMQTAHVHSFKAPSEEERSHDFLWRVHKVVPGRGHMALFNRSHYEDVLAARVHELVPKKTWRARYDRINAFESLLKNDSDTIVLKFYLHISRQEQYERLLEREHSPLSAWKLNPGDWRDLPLWDEMTEAYEDALHRCSSRQCPWYLVPADRKWFRNLAVMERIVLTLRPHRQRWLKTLADLRKRVLPQIRKLRTQAGRKGLARPKHERD
ncbi:MAG TPA: PPK2 family polyphosphate kinase [Polyangia bacterium]|nr:PPK2 family polyphosphate kinase [Polyangia bacterium]